MKLNYKKLNRKITTIRSSTKIWATKVKKEKKAKLVDFVDRKNKAFMNQKVKSLIDFDEEYSFRIKSIAIEKSSKINLTTLCLNGKMLMFSTVSIKSFVYDLMFPDQEIREIYQKS